MDTLSGSAIPGGYGIRPPLVFCIDDPCMLARAIARELGIGLAEREYRRFEDGEHKMRPLESVRDRDLYLIAPMHGNGCESVNDRIMRLLFFIRCLRDADAGRVTVVAPYLAYARKDRRTKLRDPLSLRYLATLLEASGMDRILSLDVHNSSGFDNAFRCPTVHLGAGHLLADALLPFLDRERPPVVLSPDIGGVKRAEAFRSTLSGKLSAEAGLGFMEKYRSEDVLSGGTLVGDVDGRTVVIVDDLIAGGGTISRAVETCHDQGAARILACVTHRVPGKATPKLPFPKLEKLFVTSTIPWPDDTGESERIEVVPVEPLLAAAIATLSKSGTLNALVQT